MDKACAARILGVRPAARPREINQAYAALCREYVNRSQYGMDPEDRGVAYHALMTLQDAYTVLTGSRAPDTIKPPRAASPSPSSRIPRASLGGKPPRRRPATRRRSDTKARESHPRASTSRRQRLARRFPASWSGCWPMSPERVVATGICTVMFLIALLVLGSM